MPKIVTLQIESLFGINLYHFWSGPFFGWVRLFHFKKKSALHPKWTRLDIMLYCSKASCSQMHLLQGIGFVKWFCQGSVTNLIAMTNKPSTSKTARNAEKESVNRKHKSVFSQRSLSTETCIGILNFSLFFSNLDTIFCTKVQKRALKQS